MSKQRWEVGEFEGKTVIQSQDKTPFGQPDFIAEVLTPSLGTKWGNAQLLANAPKTHKATALTAEGLHHILGEWDTLSPEYIQTHLRRLQRSCTISANEVETNPLPKIP